MSVIGMTNMPRPSWPGEAELRYGDDGAATDYDVWHEEHAAVSVEAVVANLNSMSRCPVVLAGAAAWAWAVGA